MNPACTIDGTSLKVMSNGKEIPLLQNVQGICLGLLHIAIPYILAFNDNAVFTWEKNKDEVNICCPAGFTSAKVERPNGRTCKIHVTHATGMCPRHSSNQEIVITVHPKDLEAIDAIYPALSLVKEGTHARVSLAVARSKEVLDVVTGDGHDNKIQPVDACMLQEMVEKTCPCIEVVGMKRKCARHRGMGSIKYDQLLPTGLCAFLYHAIYPTLLDMLYNGSKRKLVLASCPGIGSRVKLAIERVPKPSKPFLELLDKVFRYFRFPQDVVKDRVKVTVLNAGGGCYKQLKRGNTFWLGEKKILCPSAFDTLFPALVLRTSKRGERSSRFTCSSVTCRINYLIKTSGASRPR